MTIRKTGYLGAFLSAAVLTSTIVWAESKTYTFSGSFDENVLCPADAICGPFTAMITIDDEQTGTPVGPGDQFLYDYEDFMITFADGSVVTSATGTFDAITTGFPRKEVSLGIPGTSTIFVLSFNWQFANDAFDTDDITGILAALTSGAPLLTLSLLETQGFPCENECVGTVSLLTEKPTAVIVDIDIKPGSYPNAINVRSRGVIPVAILMTEDFDATSVDVDTVQFAGAPPLRWALEDVDGDTDWDVIFHFNSAETSIACGDTEATLAGKTLDGADITGTDSIKTVGCRR